MTESRLDLDRTRINISYSPQTPSSALKSYPTVSTSHNESPYFSTRSSTITSSRKRSRNDSLDSEAPSPAPFANMQYRLAGGIDTPTVVSSQYSLYDTSMSDTAFRRGRSYISYDRNDYFHEHGGEHIGGMPGKDGNGRAPRPVYQPGQATWGSFVVGLAGKVFNFCTARTFQGFFSGGGQGYNMKAESMILQPTLPHHGFGDNEWQDFPTTSSLDLDGEEPRAAKKSKLTDDNTWVVVQTPTKIESPFNVTKPSLLPRPSSRASLKSGSPTRQSIGASTATVGRSPKRPTENLRRTISTRTASSAGLRSPNTTSNPAPTRLSSGHRRNSSVKSSQNSLHQRQKSLVISPLSTTQAKIHSPLSTGSPTMHYGVQTHEQAESPLAKETRKHLDKVRKCELEEDIEIMRMNRQLKELIQQGKEALGTRIEVDFGDKDDW